MVCLIHLEILEVQVVEEIQLLALLDMVARVPWDRRDKVMMEGILPVVVMEVVAAEEPVAVQEIVKMADQE